MKGQGYNSKSMSSKSSNDKYMSKGMSGKVMGHDGPVKSVKVPECQGWSQVKDYPLGNRGYPSEAFDYKY